MVQILCINLGKFSGKETSNATHQILPVNYTLFWYVKHRSWLKTKVCEESLHLGRRKNVALPGK